jgi:hypothetical protein
MKSKLYATEHRTPPKKNFGKNVREIYDVLFLIYHHFRPLHHQHYHHRHDHVLQENFIEV